MATIKDISKAVGVSTASISKVLNGNYSGVSESTKERILTVASNLQYRPNRLARGLVKNQTRILGLVIPDISNPYYADMARGMEEEAEKSNYNIIFCNTYHESSRESKYLDMLIEYNVAGLLIAGSYSYDKKSMETLIRLHIPMATVDRAVQEAQISYFSNDQRGTFISTEYLIQAGHSRIAFIGERKIQGQSDLRYLGYASALRTHFIEPAKDLVKNGTYDTDTGYRCALDLLRLPKAPTAIVCGNDLIAFGAMKAIRESGLNVPDDISIVGYDDIAMASLFEPKLTTIRQNPYHLGKNACDNLLALIAGEKTEKILKYIEPELIIRDTVKRIAPQNHDE